MTSMTETPELARFLRGDISTGERRTIVRRMLASWRATHAPALEVPSQDRWPIGPVPASSLDFRVGARGPSGYTRAFERSTFRLTATAEDLAGEREMLPDLTARLFALPVDEQRSLLRTDRSFQLWSLCERLIEECHRHTYSEMSRAEDLANLAVTLSEELDPRYYGSGLVHDIRARAWACVGEVLRILSDLRSAEEAFEVAERLVERGTGDALEEAQVLELKASLLRDQRRYAEAHRLLDDAITLYRRYRDFHLVGRAFVQKGRVHGAANELEAAVRWLRKGLGLIDPARERRLELAARHSLMLCLDESGRHQEAWFLLKASRPEFLEHGGELLKLQLRWLEGRIQQSLGFLGEAEAALIEARSGFIAQGIGFSAASVSLELAALYASQGRPAEMRRIAEEMLPIFRSRDLHREAIAALIVFQQAVRLEKVSSGLLREIRSYLDRASKDHKLRFEVPA